MNNHILHDHHHDGIDRRGFLKCMAWVGTGVLYSVSGGVLRSEVLSGAQPAGPGGFRFAQISDSHIGFTHEPNTDVTATLREAVSRLNALPEPPDFIIHTGDLTHLSKPAEFDTLDQVLKSARTGQVFYVPGEHDVLTDNGQSYRERYGKGTRGDGWYSFDHKGVHFIGLVNVLNLKAGGLGQLGAEQLAWLKDDLADRPSSTPLVVFAHIPLWAVYPAWGWGTDDAAQALALLKRFGSVTVLNGHIHQVLQKVEGTVKFHTAMSTAFPQPHPGSAPSPGPMKDVPAGKLRSLLGLSQVSYVQGQQALAVVDSTLEGSVPPAADAAKPRMVSIDNFSFTPQTLTVPTGTTVTWVNQDDVPHTVTSTDQQFKSRALDTNEKFTYTFSKPGAYSYFCSVHPHMTGKILVQ